MGRFGSRSFLEFGNLRLEGGILIPEGSHLRLRLIIALGKRRLHVHRDKHQFHIHRVRGIGSPILIPGDGITDIRLLPGLLIDNRNDCIVITCLPQIPPIIRIPEFVNGIPDHLLLFGIGLLKSLADLGELVFDSCLEILGGNLRLVINNLGDLAIRDRDDLAILCGVVTIRSRIAVALLIGDIDCITLLEIPALIIPLKFALVSLQELGLLCGNLRLCILDFRHLSVNNNNHLVVIGLVVPILCRSPVALCILNEHRVTCLEILITIPGEDSLVGGHIAKPLQQPGKDLKHFFLFAHSFMVFEKFSECSLEDIHNLLDLILVVFRHKVKDSLQGKTLVSPCLDLRPHIIIDYMEFPKERSGCTFIKAIHLDSVTLDETLHHLNPLHIRSLLMHGVEIILSALLEIFLCHLSDGLRLVDYIIFAH